VAPKRVRVHLLARTDRPGGNLRLQWVDPRTGRRRGKSAGTADEAAAERERGDLEYQLNAGLAGGADPERLTWRQFEGAYRDEHLSGKSEATRVKAAGIFRNFEALIHPRSLAVVDSRALSAYAAKLRALPRAAATVEAHLAYLSAALRWAADQGMLPKAPKRPTIKVPRKANIRTVSREAFDRLLEHAPSDHWRAYLWTLWLTGMRRTEAMLLRWEEQDAAAWVDLARQRIVIPAAACKGRADSWLPIRTELRPILAQLRRARGRVFDLTTQEPSRVSKLFRRIARAAGVRSTLHDLRRTFGTRYADKVPSQVLQRLMRHSSIATTMKFYCSLDGVLDKAIHAVP
jgi:integrase